MLTPNYYKKLQTLTDADLVKIKKALDVLAAFILEDKELYKAVIGEIAYRETH